MSICVPSDIVRMLFCVSSVEPLPKKIIGSSFGPGAAAGADNEVKAICEFLRKQGSAVYEKVELPAIDEGGTGGDGEARDDVYWDAVNLVIAQRAASISFQQRRLGLGYPKAARFIDMMEQDHIIGPGQGAKPREILVGPEYLSKRGK